MEGTMELIIPENRLSFKLFLFEGFEGGYRRARHWHQSVEVFFVLEGTIEFYLGESRHMIKAHDFLIVNPNEVHSINAPLPNKTVVLQFSPRVFEECLKDLEDLTFSKRSAKLNESLASLILEMYETYESKPFAWELKARGLFEFVKYLLLTQFRDKRVNKGRQQQKHYLNRLSKITEYMRENYREPLSLDSVAHQFGFSPSHLSRMFRQYAEIGFLEYLQDLRVGYAIKEVVETNRNLGDIAVFNGFTDSRAFAKAFAKRYGCLPSEYRGRGKQKSKKVQ